MKKGSGQGCNPREAQAGGSRARRRWECALGSLERIRCPDPTLPHPVPNLARPSRAIGQRSEAPSKSPAETLSKPDLGKGRIPRMRGLLLGQQTEGAKSPTRPAFWGKHTAGCHPALSAGGFRGAGAGRVFFFSFLLFFFSFFFLALRKAIKGLTPRFMKMEDDKGTMG